MTAGKSKTGTEQRKGAPKASPAESKRVFVIDDENVILRPCRRILQDIGYEVEAFDNGLAGIERAKAARPQILLVDIKMPKLDGFQVIERVHAIDPNIVIVVITGYATIGAAVKAIKAGAYDFLPKPFSPDALRLIVGRCYEHWRLVQESQRLRREKSEVERKFVTFVTHQLKTPVVAVKQYLDVLLFSLRDEMPQTAVNWIGRSQARLGEMLAIIQDWLTLAKVEHGTLSVRGATFAEIPRLIQDVLHACQHQAEDADVTLTAAISPNLPPVLGDPGALGIVLSNLVVNATKYNRRGGKVTVGATVADEAVVLTVSDTGLGIPEECVPRLFAEFYRANAPENQKIPGTGLGLAICKRILDELGGTIAVASERSVGTTFTIRIPLADLATSNSREPPDPTVRDE